MNEIKSDNQKTNSFERDQDLPLITSLPLVAKIEVTNKCNLRCIMCREVDDSREIKSLSVDVFRKMEPIFPTLLSAYLYGIGEVLTYPHVDELVDMLIGHQVNTGLITNGLLIQEKHVARWVESGLYKLSISVDGAKKKTYESIRRGGNFDKLMHNIAMVRDLKKKMGVSRPSITFNFVAMRRNLKELPMFIEMAKEYGADDVVVSDLIVFFDYLKEEAVPYSDPLCYDNFLLAREKANALGINLVLPAPFRFQEEGISSLSSGLPTLDCSEKEQEKSCLNRCTEPWSGIWLTAEGIVTPCCYWEKPMGDLKKDTFLNIWNNPVYQGLRKIVNTENRPEHCRSCAIAGMIQRES